MINHSWLGYGYRSEIKYWLERPVSRRLVLNTEGQKVAHTYCIFCISGNELRLIKRLICQGYNAYSPMVKQWKMTAYGPKQKKVYLIPGYVFFDAMTGVEPDWFYLKSMPEVVRILHYADGCYALNEKDHLFIQWINSYNNVIDISQTVQVGTKLTFVSGPLKDCSGKIIKINKNRKFVQVSFGEKNSLLRTIYCSFEYAAANLNKI
jgi:transcription antitermination factor NusG